MTTQTLFFFSWCFLFIPYLCAFFPKVSVNARGRPGNAGNGEGAESANATNMSAIPTSTTSTTTIVPSSSNAAVSLPASSSSGPSPSPTPNTEPPTSSLGSSNISPSVDPDFPISLPQPLNSTTCGNATFVWTLADPSFNTQSKQMEVFITNDEVDQMPFLDNAASTTSMASAPNPTPVFDPDGDGDNDANSFSDPNSDGADTTLNPQIPQASHVPKMAISLPLSNTTAITSGQFTLSALALPQGWYVFAAKSDFTVPVNLSSSDNSSDNVTQTHLIIRSPPFFVADMGNTSCVPPALVQIAQQNQDQNAPTLPLSSGALAGTVVGCVIGVTILAGACLLPRFWRRGVPGHKAWIGRRKLFHIF